MQKYVNTAVVFQEIPDEVTLAINLSNCPCRCPGCHSQYLWSDTGTPLTPLALDKLIEDYGGEVTCVCFMGGDSDPKYIETLARYLHKVHPELKVAWYSGRSRISSTINKAVFDYIKVGPYIKHLGCLKEKTTNQRLYKRASGDNFTDITSRFWRC